MTRRTAWDVADAGLEELLRRCHRSELLHLAAVLRVDPRGKGLRDLCMALAHKLRWVGTHKLRALLRRFEPLEYHDVLAGLARRSRIAAEGTLEDQEQALLEKVLTEAWPNLDQESRLALWQRQGFDPPAPTMGQRALDTVHETLGPKAAFALSTVTLPALVAVATPPFLQLPGCLALWWLTRPDDRLVTAAVLEVSRLRQLVLHRVTVGVVGSPSSGKDAAIRALFGIDHGGVDPVAGSTRDVQIARLPGSTATYIVNTPGMGDVVESVTEEARQVLDHIDLYVYVVNAQGGVQARERDDYVACVRSGRPVLAVVNKIDTIKAEDRDRYLADARAKLGAPEDAFLAAAFDPLPQLADAPIGLDAVRAWLRERLLEAGKDPTELDFTEPQAAAG